MSSERSHYSEVYRTFTRIGGYARKNTDIMNAVRALKGQHVEGGTKSGHPDYVILLPPYGLFIEVKGAAQNFNFNEISPEQREWMNTFSTISYVWLFMGDGRVNGRERPRRAYLVPWEMWLGRESYVKGQGLAGLPYSPHQLAHRNLGLDCHSILLPFELQWLGTSSCWKIPHYHPLWGHLSHDTNTERFRLYDAQLASES